jgi:hypothetical protein
MDDGRAPRSTTTEEPVPDGLATLRHELADWRGRRVWLVPMTGPTGARLGNNGDELMARVLARILDDLGIDAAGWGTGGPPDGILVPPNGALLERFTFPDLLARRLADHRDVPVAVLPSSAHFPTVDPAGIFAGRTAPTTWFLRERPTLDHLTGRWAPGLTEAGVRLVLDQDVVVSGRRFVPEVLGGAAEPRRPLVAARGDAESGTGWDGRASSSPRSAARGRFEVLRRPARSAVRRARVRSRGRELVARLPADHPVRTTPARRVTWTDPSAPAMHSFDEYCALVRGASVVVTDRLHVAIPAALLGTPVELMDSGYHKLRGVYERSLADLPHVHLVDR